MNLRQILSAWDRFWFAESSPLPLAFYRIFAGLIVVEFCLWIIPQSTTFFGPHGVVSAQSSSAWVGWSKFDLLAFVPMTDTWLYVLIAVLTMAAICLTLGLFSRTSAFVVYLCLLSLDAQNQFVFHAGLKFLYVMIFFLALSRCGEALSLDRYIRCWRLGQSRLQPVKSGSIVALRLMQLQLALVYWSSFSWKIHGQDWMDGSAVYYATHCLNAQNLLSGIDSLLMSKILSWGTLALEFSLCTLIWIKEFRYPVLLLGLLFHLGLEWALIIPLFQQIMIASYVLFISPSDLEKIIGFIKQRCLYRQVSQA